MLRDGELVYAAERQTGSLWLASGCRARGVAYVLLGRPQEAVTVLREALTVLKDHPEFVHFRVFNLGYVAFAAADLGDGRDLQRWAIEADQLVAAERLEETAGGAIASTAAALAHEQRGDHTETARQLERVRQRRRYLPGVAWLDADLALRCAHVSLDLGDPAGAVEFAQVAGDALRGYPDAGALPARLVGVEERIRRGEAYGLTSSELRVLGFLPTHLSLQEIADRLFLSRSTIKTHVASIYDKLAVPGRSEAVEIIEQIGLGSTEG
jgi:LuxR family maltose regulon positive regulatory protein